MRRIVLIVTLVLCSMARPGLAQPAAPTAPPLSGDQARTVLGVLQDDKKRAEFTAVLEDMVRAMPAAQPAAAASPAALAPDSVGAQLLLSITAETRGLSAQVRAAGAALSALPQTAGWLAGLVTDPGSRALVLDTAWKLALVLAGARATEWLLIRALRRPRRALARHVPGGAPTDVSDDAHRRGFSVAWHMLRRLPLVLLAFVLDVIPAMVFAVVGNALLSTPLGETANARLVVIAVVNAYVVCRFVLCVARAFVSPGEPRLRIVVCRDDTAAYVMRWLRGLTVVAVCGFAMAEVALLFGLSRPAHDVVLKLFGLVLHGMLIVMVLQTRQAVANRLRAPKRARGFLAAAQNFLARNWHLIAIFWIVALWLVAAAQVRDGYSRLLHVFLVTSGVLLAARLATIVLLGGLDRVVNAEPGLTGRFAPLQPRLHRYRPALRTVIMALIGGATLVALLQVWGVDALDWFSGDRLGNRALAAATTSAVTIALAIVVWEAANAGVDGHLAGLTRQAQMARATRLRTLLPILRTTLMVVILAVAGLVVLSEVGVNVAPLLAGAGVFGIAIGFGSQKLVQDLITGLFLLLENTMQVGDVVTLGGLTGTVEMLSIRTIQMRALDGSMHIIPFSSVTTVTNQTRDFSYALIDLAVGLNEEPDHITGIVQDIGRDMRAEPRWADAITAEPEVLGVHGFADNSWTLRLRIRTEPAQRWAVSREFNRRVKYRFDKLAVQSPITAYAVQGWAPPGSERALPQDPVPRQEPS